MDRLPRRRPSSHLSGTHTVCVIPGSYDGPHQLLGVAEELPSDVRAVLTQLLEAAETAVQDGEYGTARRILETVGTVSSNKLPDRQRREQFRHGCTRVREALDPVAEPELASEYLRAMARRLCSSSV